MGDSLGSSIAIGMLSAVKAITACVTFVRIMTRVLLGYVYAAEQSPPQEDGQKITGSVGSSQTICRRSKVTFLIALMQRKTSSTSDASKKKIQHLTEYVMNMTFKILCTVWPDMTGPCVGRTRIIPCCAMLCLAGLKPNLNTQEARDDLIGSSAIC